MSICLLLSVGLLQVIPGRYIKGTPLERIMITHSENIRSGESRLLIWESAVQAVQKSPLVGYGSEVISEALAPYLSKELYQHETLSGMPDRTHNTILDLLINGGIIGLILWICLWCKIGHDVRKYSSIVHSPLPYLFISSIGFIIGSFFGVATTVHYVFLWTFGAILLKEGEQYTEKQYHLSLPIRVIPICILTVGMGYLFIRGYADIQFAQGFKENNYLLMEEAYQRTTEPFYGVHVLGKTIHSPALSSTTQHVITSLQQRAPAFVDVWIFSALFAQYVGNHDDVHTYFERAKEHAPLSPFLWEEWAKYHIHKGETAQAIQKLTHLLSITPPYWEWDATIDQRNAEEQKQHRIFFKENPHFRNNFLLLARAYFEEGNEERALFYLQHAPQDSIDTLSTYGVIYGTKKEYKKAFMYFEKALALDPTNTQMKQNIEVLHTQCKC